MKLFGNKFSKHKIKRRFRLSFTSDNTFNELWSVKLSRVKVFISTIVIIGIIVFVVSAIIVSTPLKTLLPGYLKSDVRNENIKTSLRLDSLEQEIAIKEKYLLNFHNIIIDNINLGDYPSLTDSTATLTVDSLPMASVREKEFIKQFDESEKFNLSVLTPLAAEGILFSTPFTGVIMDPVAKNEMRVRVQHKAPISSIYDGVVIGSYYSIGLGNSIVIQHPNGFISIYKNIGITFSDKGSKVSAGQRIASANEDGTATNSIIGFELWHDGIIVNPQEYITF